MFLSYFSCSHCWNCNPLSQRRSLFQGLHQGTPLAKSPDQSLLGTYLCLPLLFEFFSTLLFSSSPNNPYSPCLSSFHPSIMLFNNCNLLTMLDSLSSRKMDFDITFSCCFYAWDVSKQNGLEYFLPFPSFQKNFAHLASAKKNVVITFISNC